MTAAKITGKKLPKLQFVQYLLTHRITNSINFTLQAFNNRAMAWVVTGHTALKHLHGENEQ